MQTKTEIGRQHMDCMCLGWLAKMPLVEMCGGIFLHVWWGSPSLEEAL